MLCSLTFFLDDLFSFRTGGVVIIFPGVFQIAVEVLGDTVADLYLVGDGLFDVDALDAAVVVGQPGQRYDDVFVDLECIGMCRYCGSPCTDNP